MLVKCPYCSQTYDVANSSKGETVTCQSCGNQLSLPEIRNGRQVVGKTVVVRRRGLEQPRVGGSLVNCPKCGRQVSPDAQTCPQCGHPLQEKKEAGGTILGFLFGLFGLCIAAIVWGVEGVKKALLGMAIHFVVLIIFYWLCIAGGL